MPGFITVTGRESDTAYMPVNSFTTEHGNNIFTAINRFGAPTAQACRYWI